MKTKLFLRAIALGMGCMLTFTGISSFSIKKQTCDITCNWVANNAAMPGVSISTCSNNDGGTASFGSTFLGTVTQTCGTTVTLTTFLATGHPAGTIYIYKNHTLVLTHTVAAHSLLGYDDPFTATCGDTFTVIF
jgi:hypothetical protein